MADPRITIILEARDLASGTIRKTRAEVGGFDKAMANLRQQFTLGTVAGNLITQGIYRIGGAFGDSIGAAIDFQTNMRNVNSISKVSEGRFAGMSQQVLDLSKTLPQSATELSEGLYNIASSGFQGAEGMQVLEAAAKAASAGLSTTDEAAKGLTAVLNAYHLSADEASRISDIMFQTVNLGVITFSELSAEIGKTTALAAPLGVTFEEVSGALSLMTRNGIDAANATTQINAIMNNLLKPSQQAVALAEDLGLGWDAETLKARGLSGVLSDLVEKTHGNHEQMATLLGDQRAIRGAFVLAADGGSDLNAEIAKMTDSAGATSGALGEQQKGLAFQIKVLQNNIQALVTKGLTAIMPGLTNMVRATTDLLPLITELGGKAVPILAVAIGIKLVTALRLAATEAKLAGLALKGGLLLGIPLLLEGLNQGTNAFGRFRAGMDDAAKGAVVWQTLTDNINQFGFATKETQQAFDGLIAASDASGKGLDLLTQHFLRLRSEGKSVDEALRQVWAAIYGGWNQSKTDTNDLISEGKQLWASNLAHGAGIIEDAAHRMSAGVPHAYRLTKEEVKALAAQTPSDIATAIITGKVDIDAIRQRMREIIANPVSDARALAVNSAVLLNPKIAEALASNSSDAKAAMLAEVVNPMLASMATLNPKVFSNFKNMPPGIARILNQQGPQVVAAMRDLIHRQNAPLSDLAKLAERWGLEGVASLIRGMIAKKKDVRDASDEVRGEVDLSVDATQQGRDVAQSWINGMVAELLAAHPEVNNAAYRFAGVAFPGNSLPRSGPFSAPHLKRTSGEVVDAWVGNLGNHLSRGMGAVTSRLPALGTTGGVGIPGGAQYATVAGTGGRALTINVQLPPTTVPYSPAQYDDAARSLVPPILREMQRQGF